MACVPTHGGACVPTQGVACVPTHGVACVPTTASVSDHRVSQSAAFCHQNEKFGSDVVRIMCSL